MTFDIDSTIPRTVALAARATRGVVEPFLVTALAHGADADSGRTFELEQERIDRDGRRILVLLLVLVLALTRSRVWARRRLRGRERREEIRVVRRRRLER